MPINESTKLQQRDPKGETGIVKKRVSNTGKEHPIRMIGYLASDVRWRAEGVFLRVGIVVKQLPEKARHV
ncbi:hypothetical protein [Mesorhizobium sp. 131-2-1]|uniref:hypothetical protein n=1 Tax=Mesorhizobium sp. 131-2-1 TaxID=2744518 RepID=UPI00192728F2|nr:hypothetical protein [Mesorhizobium sp. 131-2-1]